MAASHKCKPLIAEGRGVNPTTWRFCLPLGDLVADGSLSAAVEQVYPLDQFKEAFEHSLTSSSAVRGWPRTNSLRVYCSESVTPR